MSFLFLVFLVVFGLLVYFVWPGNKNGSRTYRRGKNSHFNKDGRPKRTYDTKSEATVVAKRQGAQEHSKLDAYRCATCKKWHVGHQR